MNNKKDAAKGQDIRNLGKIKSLADNRDNIQFWRNPSLQEVEIKE